nr:hypothetical protein [Sphingomicrobium nitratireducens]
MTIIAAMLASTAPAAQDKAAAPQPVTKAAYIKAVDARFGGLDADKNGSLTATEIVAAQKRLADQRAAMLKERRTNTFKAMDKDGNGQVSLAEWEAAAPKPKPFKGDGSEVVKQLDANKDGYVTLAEYRAPQIASFDKLDANKDGSLSPAERAPKR